MDSNNTPATTTQSSPDLPATADQDYSQAVVDKVMRKTIVEICRAPVGTLRSLTPDEISAMPAFKAMWISIMLKASNDAKPDMRAAEFIQEHLAGKAIQRIEAHTTTVTYQDLISRVRRSEERYQDVVTVTVTAPTPEPDWGALK